jgi:hypothetical protein
MTKEEAILLAKSHLTEEMKSRSSSGHAERIDQEYMTTNAEWLSKKKRETEQKLGTPFPPIDKAAIVPHWFVTFTVLAHERKPVALEPLGFNIYDDGTVQQLPSWPLSIGDVLGLVDQGSAGNAT